MCSARPCALTSNCHTTARIAPHEDEATLRWMEAASTADGSKLLPVYATEQAALAIIQLHGARSAHTANNE